MRFRDAFQALAGAEHFADVGKHLGKATESFNSAVGSLEHRVLVSARRFKDLGAASGEEPRELSVLDALPRAVRIPELQAGTAGPRPYGEG